VSASDCHWRLLQGAWVSSKYVRSDIGLFISSSFPCVEISKSFGANFAPMNIGGGQWNLLEIWILSCWWQNIWCTALDLTNFLNCIFGIGGSVKIYWLQGIGWSFSFEISVSDISVVNWIILCNLAWSVWMSNGSIGFLNVIQLHYVSRIIVLVLLSYGSWTLNIINILLIPDKFRFVCF